MRYGITLDQVYDAMRAAGREPATPEGMQAALQAAGLWDGNGAARVTIALSAYGLLGPGGSAEADMQRALEAVAELATPKPPRAEVTIAEVRQALRDWLPESGGFVKMGDDRMLRLLRERLRLDFTASGAAGHYVRHRFEGQVTRALNSLARDGELRKVGAGTRGPTGQVTGQHEAWFYTPDAWAGAEARTAEKTAGAKALEARAAAVLDGLDKLGVYARPRNEWVYLDLESAERLLALAETGAREPGAAAVLAGPDTASDALRAHYAEPEGLYDPGPAG